MAVTDHRAAGVTTSLSIATVDIAGATRCGD
jgi:hypothetical protein